MDTPPQIINLSRPKYQVADVLRQYGDTYREQYHPSLEQLKVMRAIEQCRTAALGGHVDECDHCGVLRISYNSCRNRHCPTCGALKQARWIEARQADLLPVPYFHVVFTLDHAINPLARSNPRAIYELLFASAAQILKAFGAQYLKGVIGAIAVLHTWGQNLEYHIHLHCIVTGGALSFDQSRWNACPKDFLFPVLPLSQAFRDRFCQGLARLRRRGALTFAGECAELQDAQAWDRRLAEMQAKNWQVYIQAPLAGPEHVLRYLGRYVQRVALSNHRLVAIENGQVRFRWRDNQHSGQEKVMALPAVEFIRRFLLHGLPPEFVRIRYYGLWSPRYRATRLCRCRELLGGQAQPVPAAHEDWAALLLRLTGVDVRRCPRCGIGTMVHRRHLDPLANLFVSMTQMPQPALVRAAV